MSEIKHKVKCHSFSYWFTSQTSSTEKTKNLLTCQFLHYRLHCQALERRRTFLLVKISAHCQRAEPQHGSLHPQPGVDEVDGGLHVGVAPLVVAGHVAEDQEAPGKTSNLENISCNYTSVEINAYLIRMIINI